MLFPSVSVPGELTRIALSDVHAGDDLPNVNALLSTDDPTAYADAPESTPRAVPLLTEHAQYLHPSGIARFPHYSR